MEWEINMNRKKVYWVIIICVAAFTVWAAYFRQAGTQVEEGGLQTDIGRYYEKTGG